MTDEHLHHTDPSRLLEEALCGLCWHTMCLAALYVFRAHQVLYQSDSFAPGLVELLESGRIAIGFNVKLPL